MTRRRLFTWGGLAIALGALAWRWVGEGEDTTPEDRYDVDDGWPPR